MFGCNDMYSFSFQDYLVEVIINAFVLCCLQDEMTNALASMRFEPDKVARLKEVGKSSNALLNRRKK